MLLNGQGKAANETVGARAPAAPHDAAKGADAVACTTVPDPLLVLGPVAPLRGRALLAQGARRHYLLMMPTACQGRRRVRARQGYAPAAIPVVIVATSGTGQRGCRGRACARGRRGRRRVLNGQAWDLFGTGTTAAAAAAIARHGTCHDSETAKNALLTPLNALR